MAASDIKLRDLEAARHEYEQVLSVAEPLSLASPDDQEVLYALAETYTGEGALSARFAEGRRTQKEKLADWEAAHNWFQKSLNAWSKVSHPARISPTGFKTIIPEEVSRRLAQCDAQLAALKESAPSDSSPQE